MYILVSVLHLEISLAKQICHRDLKFQEENYSERSCFTFRAHVGPLGGTSTHRKLGVSTSAESTPCVRERFEVPLDYNGCNIIETLNICELEDSVAKELRVCMRQETF